MSVRTTILALVAVAITAGCNQRATYLVICPEDGSGCFAAGGRTDIR